MARTMFLSRWNIYSISKQLLNYSIMKENHPRRLPVCNGKLDSSSEEDKDNAEEAN